MDTRGTEQHRLWGGMYRSPPARTALAPIWVRMYVRLHPPYTSPDSFRLYIQLNPTSPLYHSQQGTRPEG